MRLAFLGPAGTFSEEALRGALDVAGHELVPVPTVDEAVMAVQDGAVDRALVPTENALEGAVAATLDTLATEAADAWAEAICSWRRIWVRASPPSPSDHAPSTRPTPRGTPAGGASMPARAPLATRPSPARPLA